MSKHLLTEIEKLKKLILSLCAVVEESVYRAVKAVSDRDSKLGAAVEQSDNTIDDLEVDVEEECLKILALHQPVAIDLRFIVAVMKINNDLERIGDLAVNIAGRAISLAKIKPVDSPFDFNRMAELVKAMLRKSIQALVKLDTTLAKEVLASDDAVDELNREMYIKIRDSISRNPDEAESYLYLLSVSRNLERIGDHATNIAEDVVYMIDGTIIRHGRGR